MQLIGFVVIAELGLAVWVRGRTATLPPPPERPDEVATLAEPMQFLEAGGAIRADELTPYISVEHTLAWQASFGTVFSLGGCPDLHAWVQAPFGQDVVQLIGELRRGSSEEGLAALALIFQLARNASWAPGAFGGEAAGAEQLGDLLEDWLRTWGEQAATDPLLYEPALAAGLLYGRALHTAWGAPALGTRQSALARAQGFFDELCGVRSMKRSAYGDALHARYPHAYSLLTRDEDPLSGLVQVAESRFPDHDGACGE